VQRRRCGAQATLGGVVRRLAPEAADTPAIEFLDIKSIAAPPAAAQSARRAEHEVTPMIAPEPGSV